VLKQHIVSLGRRELDKTLGPELLEARQRQPLCRRAGTHAIVDPLAPLHLVPTFRECVLVAEAPRQFPDSAEIVARLASRIYGPVHGEDEGVARRSADIIALEWRGGRQNDICVPCRRGPPALMHDDGLRLLPGALQSVEVLMMMERVSACPIDERNVGIAVS